MTTTTSAGVVVIDDNAENGDNGWSATGLWHRTSHRASSASSSWYYGQEGLWTYDTGDANSGALTSREVDLSGYNDAVLTFSNYRKVEAYGVAYDVCAVEASNDGGATWNRLMTRDSSSPETPGWTNSGAVPLTSFVGGRLLLRFSFDTVDANSNGYEGWYVDDIRITAEEPAANSEQPDPYHHRVELAVNGDRFRCGDRLYITATVKRGELCSYNVCDAYLSVSLPNGREIFVSRGHVLSGKAMPLASSFKVRDVSVTIGPFILPPGLQGGSYSVRGVLMPSQTGTGRGASMVSNLSEVSFTVNQ